MMVVEKLFSVLAQIVRGRGTMVSSRYLASSNNFTVATRPSSEPIDLIVIHVTQCSFVSTIKRFQDPSSRVSAHYTIRFSDGFIAQSVRDKDIAWHSGNWSYNQRSIGIEHEGYVEDSAFFTDAIYRSSAKLTAYLVDKYGIPPDRQHIVGHDEVPSPSNPGLYGGADEHQDPGSYFDWEKYMDYIHLYLSR